MQEYINVVYLDGCVKLAADKLAESQATFRKTQLQEELGIKSNPEFASSDIAQPSLSVIFGLMPRIAFGSLVAYVISNLHDIWAFDFWKRKRPGRNTLWLRNNLSTFASQLIDTLVFTLIAFWGVYPTAVLIQIMLSTYLLKWVVAMLDTPFMYLARHWYENGKLPASPI